MSTKIYNGFKLKSITSLDGVMDFINSIRQDIVNIAKENWAKNLLSISIFDYDRAHYNNEDITVNFYGEAFNKMHDTIAEAKIKGYRTHLDFGTEISFKNVKIGNKKSVVGILFTECPEIQKYFFGQNEIEDYSYYNNTDKPDEISDKEWKQRGKIWDKVIDSRSCAQSMLSSQIIEPYTVQYPDKLTLSKCMPTFEERLNVLSRDLTMMKFDEANKDEINYSKMIQYQHSDEFRINRDNLKNELKTKIKQHITFKDFNGGRE